MFVNESQKGGNREDDEQRSPAFRGGVAGVAMVGLAACGSLEQVVLGDDRQSGDHGPTTADERVSLGGLSGMAPFVIGSVTDVTEPRPPRSGSANRALEAWADWTNANGGINGHPVKLIAMDTGFNPSTALSEVKEMVEQDHIIALVGEQTSFDATFAGYLQQKGIPAVGGGLFTQAPTPNPDWFPQGTTSIPRELQPAAPGHVEGVQQVCRAVLRGVPGLRPVASRCTRRSPRSRA